jgi:hypothetical protein
MLYIYPFAELHSATYARCQRMPHAITFWFDGEVVGEAIMYLGRPGNVAVRLPETEIGDLASDAAYFEITEQLIKINPPTLGVKAEFKRRS